MKWSLFNWKKPVVSSGEPEDYQVVKNTVSQNERNITNINSQITNVNNQLNNTVSTNTAQTITGAKTFNEGITINKTPIPLLLKATSDDKSYIVFRDSANNSNLSIGANAASTSIEVNRGDLTIQTQQDNKTVAFETGTIKTNRARLEFGTEINAGYGGGTVKFIPEDNSTKTLQFFNNNANDTRRFKLAVPEPVDNNNPATKQYVDTQISSSINAGPYIRYQDLPIVGYGNATSWGIYSVYTIGTDYSDVVFMGATIQYPREVYGRAWEFSYNFEPTRIHFNFRCQKADKMELPPIDSTFIRIFYVGNLQSRSETPFSQLTPEENNEN